MPSRPSKKLDAGSQRWIFSVLVLLITGCGDNGQAGDDGTCQNQCAEGTRFCDGNGFRLCTKQPSGCLDWDTAVSCPDGELCLADRCVDGQGIAYWEKVYTTPDYLQADAAYGGLPGGGGAYCGPVAVSNSLMWLDDNGFDKLASNSGDRKKDQFDLISLLGSYDYMNADAGGTDLRAIASGVQKYLESLGYAFKEIKYQSWQQFNIAPWETGVDVPELEWIKKSIQGKSAVWLQVGWYIHDASTDTYEHDGGHWLTLVGYGFDEDRVDPNYLVIHDPGAVAGADFANEHVLLEKIESGTLNGDFTDLPHSASGYYKLTGGMHVPGAQRRVAILDGVLALRME